MNELTERAARAKGFKAMAGMMDWETGARIVYAGLLKLGTFYEGQLLPLDPDCFTPDLTDPATLGCLLQLVREAWGDPRAGVAYDCEGDGCWEWRAKGRRASWHLTEAEALVAALEAAP